MINTISEAIRLNDGNSMPGFGLGVYKAKAGEETYSTVMTALELGYRMIDTAAFYNNEEDVGKAVRDSGIPRNEIFIATKLWPQYFNNAETEFNESYNKLGLDYIDLYMLHWPGLDEKLRYSAWETILKYKEKGMIRSAGVSNFLAEQLEEMTQKTGVTPVNNQVELHPWNQQREVRKYCQENGITVTAWGPIFHGHLNEEPVMAEIGQKYGKSPAQVTLRWHIQNGVIAIPKSSNKERLTENILLFDFSLLPEDMELIDSLDGKTRFGASPLVFDGSQVANNRK